MNQIHTKKLWTINKLASLAEIAFWDSAIALMSNNNIHHGYSYTVAAMTLRIQPYPTSPANLFPTLKIDQRITKFIRLGIFSGFGLILGILLGWLKSM
jgi:hypothetical protein